MKPRLYKIMGQWACKGPEGRICIDRSPEAAYAYWLAVRNTPMTWPQ